MTTYYEHNDKDHKNELPDNVIEFTRPERKIEVSESMVVEHLKMTDELRALFPDYPKDAA